jgi:hypothetical protein
LSKKAVVLLCTTVAFLAACGGVSTTFGNDWLSQIDARSNKTKPFISPWPSREFYNYTKAQKLYADQNTIIWCSTTWGNASAPIVTVPIAGKLTSSSVSFFPSSRVKVGDMGGTEYTPERRSVDGMYHGSPPPYRYGFTPGGQYVDFFNMPTFCTTALTKFQRQETKVAVSFDQEALVADRAAEAALRSGNPSQAQKILSDALGK